MKILIYVYLLLTFFFCSSVKGLAQNESTCSKYLIKKIETKNSWYIIYAKKHGSRSLCKIVVGKSNETSDDCKKIVVGKYYELELKSRRENAPEINNIKIKPVNYLDVECFSYDEETNICIEPRKGIYDLYYTKDLKGLCYLNRSKSKHRKTSGIYFLIYCRQLLSVQRHKYLTPKEVECSSCG